MSTFTVEEFSTEISEQGEMMLLARDGGAERMAAFLERYMAAHGHTGCLAYTDSRGRTALHVAAKHGHLGVVRALVKCGADPHVLDRKNRCPLFISVFYRRRRVLDFLSGGAMPWA